MATTFILKRKTFSEKPVVLKKFRINRKVK